MKRNIAIIFLLLIQMHMSFAQRTCGTMEHTKKQLQSNPEYGIARKTLANYTSVSKKSYRRSASLFQPQVITIPVVVHIVLPHPEIITDEQVASQIEVLNRDFRNLNTETPPEEFQDEDADTEIEFRLASIDPEGNSTSGITRTATTHEGVFENDDISYTSLGGKDIWNNQRYLNIWVGMIGDMGYSYFPGGDPAVDGVVITYDAFGISQSNSYNYNRGRTAVHEIGHWFNLEHIWGDEENGGGCFDSDYVDDTPNQNDADYDCPVHPLYSCETVNMFMNYMDYVNDDCMIMFSNGQSARMHDAISGSRTLLPSVVLDQDITDGTHNLTSANFIWAKNTLSNGTSISYCAGNGITLEPGFHAESGSNFIASINNCTELQPSQEEKAILASPQAIARESGLMVYPNPSNGTFSIEMLSKCEDSFYELYDFSGKLIHTDPIVTETTTVNLSNNKPGIYLLRVINGDQIEKRKLVFK